MSFSIKPATRQGIIPLVGFWGSTGGGKTKSALLFARGLAGPSGRVVIIDTEGRRASYYSDSIPGGYQTLDFDGPYTPERYIEAFDMVEKNADVAVADSLSYAWDGPDGVLEMHEQVIDKILGKNADDWKAREACSYRAWNEPKKRFKYLTNRLLACRIPLILCFQGEEKTRMVKEQGKTALVTDTTTSPIFDKKFPFKMHINLEVYQREGRGGFTRYPYPYAKTSHEEIRKLLPAPDEQLGIKHGEALAKWCAAPVGTPGNQVASEPAKSLPTASKALSDAKKDLWKITAKIHKESSQALQQWLWDEALMAPDENLSGITLERLIKLIHAVEKKLNIGEVIP